MAVTQQTETQITDTQLIMQQEGAVRILTLNRPAKRNALSLSMLQDLYQALSDAGKDKATKVVILQANGPVFSSGHDLKEMPGRTEDDYRTLFATCANVMQLIRKIPQPVMAKVQGLATAAGCQLVAACDLAYAAEGAQFATPGVRIGLFCTTPMVPLVRNVPAKVAMEMLLTGQPITAQRAQEVGLINRVVSAAELDASVMELANHLCQSSSLVNAIGKKAFYDQLSLSEAEAYAQAVEVMTKNMLEHDAQEGVAAFIGKRPPVWKNE